MKFSRFERARHLYLYSEAAMIMIDDDDGRRTVRAEAHEDGSRRLDIPERAGLAFVLHQLGPLGAKRAEIGSSSWKVAANPGKTLVHLMKTDARTLMITSLRKSGHHCFSILLLTLHPPLSPR